MNPKIILWTVFLSLLFWGCSNDDTDLAEDEASVSISDFQLIGEDAESVFQYSYDAATDTGTVSNLTQDNNVDLNYITLSQASDLISFFSFSDGNFSLIEKNVRTGSSQFIENFISVSDDRSIIWGATSENQIFMSYYSLPGSGELGLRTIDIGTGSFVDTPLATDVFDTTNPLYFNGRLFVAYIDVTDKYHMVVFDTENLVVIRELDFEDFFPSILIDSEGNPVIIKGIAGSDFVLELYDLETMDLLGTSSFTLNQFLTTGPLDAYLISNKLYYLDILIQPSPVPFAPAVFDFGTSINSTIDIFAVLQTAQQELGSDIFLTSYGFDANNRIFLIGFSLVAGLDNFNGGVLIIEADGSVIDIIELPFIPTYFVKP